ncbi:hypothetical protein [Massilia sp. S19_KUP03_FR1]|uniref:hypothetical protein n=1 Tax=Massilia sp. S19_KUP03_FR1 TaxID=3025503 RepID=UPI002FCD7A64
MTTIESAAPGPDAFSSGPRRVDTANQRAAWLRQMELVQMAGMKSTPAAAAPPPLRATSTAPAPAPTHDGEGAATGHRASVPAAHDSSTAARADRAGDPPAARAVTPVAAVPAESMRRASGSAPGAVPAPVLLPVTPRSVAPAGVVIGAVAAVRAPLPRALPSAPGRADPPDPGAAPDYQKQRMHLTGEGDDVKLWIRDGALAPATSQQLVARLAGDVAAMGLRLKQASINGKPALFAAAVPATGTAPLQPIIHPTTER